MNIFTLRLYDKQRVLAYKNLKHVAIRNRRNPVDPRIRLQKDQSRVVFRAEMLRLIVVVCVIKPLTAVTVKVKLPVGTDERTFIARVDVAKPPDGGVTGLGKK